MTAGRIGGAAVALVVLLGHAHAGDPVTRGTMPWRTCADGSFAMPGTDGCVHLSGQLSAESTLRFGATRTAPGPRASLFHQRAIGRVSADVRIPTELGPVRVYTQLRAGSAPEPDTLRR